MKLKPTFKQRGFLKKVNKATQIYVVLTLIFLFFLFILSAVEVALGIVNHSVQSSFMTLWGWSCLEDIIFFLTVLFPAFLVFLPIYLLSPKISKFTFGTAVFVFFTLQLILMIYFNSTLLMLGSDIFGYSFAEIMQIVGASGSIDLSFLLIFGIVTGSLIFSISYIPKKFLFPSELSYTLPAISMIFLILGMNKRSNSIDLSTQFETNLVTNKSQHFYSAAYSHFNPQVYEPDIYAETYLDEFVSKFANAEPFEYIDESTYPFLHKELERDVLSPFFETREVAPNIVIIIVEGLGRAYTNRGAYLGNFTPFLDSLSTKSLYWPNFLSNGGRTFAVLPSLLGSLPFAENGFMEMENKMPDQFSLLNLLKNNGYNTSFYYGGNSEFDKMALYLQKNKVDRIIDENDFTSDYKKIPASASGFTWGYGDKELFRYYSNSKLENNTNPTLDVILTVSMHNPFLIDETEKYTGKFENKLTEFGFSEEKKERYRKYTKQYTSILFADDALKNFIESYKEREDFQNSIFIITGDHRIPEIPMASKIDRYHVPMIIYSPLLKRTAEFQSVSSHFDLAPSLLSLLKYNYKLQVPIVNGFVGKGLDTTRNFQNIHNIALKQTKTDLIDFVMGEYHLNGEDLYKLSSDLREVPVQDESKKKELENAFNQFKRKNSEIIKGKQILPDSLYRNYSSQ